MKPQEFDEIDAALDELEIAESHQKGRADKVIELRQHRSMTPVAMPDGDYRIYKGVVYRLSEHPNTRDLKDAYSLIRQMVPFLDGKFEHHPVMAKAMNDLSEFTVDSSETDAILAEHDDAFKELRVGGI